MYKRQLGSFTLLAILLGLVVLCGLSFGLGYVVGRREPTDSSTVLEPKPIAAQGDTAKGKPSGGTGGGSGGGAADGASSGEGSEAESTQPGSDQTDSRAAGGGADASKGAQPVSYTHLDVYKRQALVQKPVLQAYLVLGRLDLAAGELSRSNNEASAALSLDPKNRKALELRTEVEAREAGKK